MLKRICFCIVAFLIFPVCAQAVTSEQLDKAIAAAKQYLYKNLAADGTWERADNSPDLKTTGKHHGGATAIAVFGLLAAGENANEPNLQRAIAFLKKDQPDSVYVLGTRMQVWYLMPETAEIRRLISQDKDAIVAQLKLKAPARGLFYYPKTFALGNYDHSISQFGVLGLWAADQKGAEVSSGVWGMMENAWREHQMPDGGWTYIHPKNGGDKKWGENDTNPSMTTAGVATLYITQEYTRSGNADCRGNLADPNIDAGLKFLADHFQDIFQPPNDRMKGLQVYSLFGIERVGRASGLKYIGQRDWFEEGANFLVRTQDKDGHFGGQWDMFGNNPACIPSTALSMVFLARGRAPIIINKLSYDVLDNAGKVEAGRWNQRPRDIANFTNWFAQQSEGTRSWQIMRLDSPLIDWHGAPILYLSGDQALKFTDEQENKLRQYCENGGMIVASADCLSDRFSDSFRKLGQKLFPSYEFRTLPDEHPILNDELFNRTKIKNKPNIMSLGNGCREMMILFPNGDFSKAFQMRNTGSRLDAYQVMTNLVLYASEKSNFVGRNQSYVLAENTTSPTDKVFKLARLKHDSNWNPEPGGWRRTASRLRTEDKIELQMSPVRLDASIPTDIKLAHLTGTGSMKFSDAEARELKKYVQAGGTVLIDTAAGNIDFATSMASELARIFETRDSAMTEAGEKMNSLISKSAIVDGKVYRNYSRKNVGSLKSPRFRVIEINSRPGVIFLPDDLSVGLVGQPIDGVSGYTPAVAYSIVRNLVLNTK